MLAISILSVFLVSSNAIALAPTGCNGADPAIVSVAVKNVSQNGPINVYHLAGTVTNVGNRNQTSNVLQFVNIYVNRQKLDSRGIPPLRRGQSYTFGYDFQRSHDAGDGSSSFRFQLDMRQPSGSAQDCNANNDTFRLQV
jgi:hypothetical protein